MDFFFHWDNAYSENFTILGAYCLKYDSKKGSIQNGILAYFCILLQLAYCGCSGLQSSPKTPSFISCSQELNLVRCAKYYDTHAAPCR
jgi:hypothetical protein